ncbi:hypothetical protein BS47DRAFT_1324420 [Hydnum rufescens UP504]|uniref:Uncharacterized protein n=1 Tax=Hydnum rufescens UP504 TaxID=1448309 RepID=A0A9P6E258_9AGAM|nr:hypothetical protein BS47DRAFT_1324420 [Hydnum rufescens UP504]
MASFGRELPVSRNNNRGRILVTSIIQDQVDLLDRRTGAQLVLLQDIQTVIRERASLEANYAKTLLAIAKKTEKLNRQHIAAGVLGDNPSKPITDEALKRSTLETALSFLAESFDKTAQEHLSYSEVLNVQVADELRSLERKKEETRKKHANFYNKLVADRDVAYSDRSKVFYYSDCEELETYRQKQDRATDDKHAERAAKLHEQMHVSMLDRKNTYLVAISVSNKVKDLFYSESVPTVEDQYRTLEVLQTSITSRLINILQNYSAFTASHLSTLAQTVEILQKTLGGVDHSKDHELFIEYNRRPFTVPSDWSFEPCSSFYDTADMSIEPEPKLFLQNKLARSQAKLAELQPVLEAKQKDVSRLNQLVEAYTADIKLGSVDVVLDVRVLQYTLIITASHDFYTGRFWGPTHRSTFDCSARYDYGSQAPHSFKSSSFAVPTLCAYCKTNIWGLSKQGKICKMCGITVHSKCELKIPAACTGTQPGGTSRRKSTLAQTPSPGTSSIHSFANSQGLYLTTPRGESALNPQNGSALPGMAATILFDFESSSTFELTVSSGTQVQIIEDDDGSGWVKVSDGRKTGLVPASYLSMDDSSSSPTSSIAAKPGPRATKKKVRGLYAYDAQGDDELNVIEGGTLELTPGGEEYADGWYQGVDSRGKIGIFPSNYVSVLSPHSVPSCLDRCPHSRLSSSDLVKVISTEFPSLVMHRRNIYITQGLYT